jgi:hypothetical protein
MVRAFVFNPLGNRPRVASAAIHDPYGRDISRRRAAENDLLAFVKTQCSDPAGRPMQSNAKSHFLIGFPRLVRTDPDRHFPVQAFQEFKQLVRGEEAEMPVHQVGHFRLGNAKQRDDFPLLELSVLEYRIDMKPNLCPCEKLVSLLKPQVRKDIAGAFLEFAQ